MPVGTYLSSAYRSPAYQLRVIQDLARKYNADPRNKGHEIPIPQMMDVNNPGTWLPTLRLLRKHSVVVNAPSEVRSGHRVEIRSSPHSALRVVFDLANHHKSRQQLDEIEAACRMAEKCEIVGFNQVKVEPDPKQMAVHVDVKWVSRRALDELWTQMGFATV